MFELYDIAPLVSASGITTNEWATPDKVHEAHFAHQSPFDPFIR
jgi:hypothetical protein